MDGEAVSPAPSALFLGLDSGTQSAKAGIWDLRGTCLARASCALAVRTPHEGWAEQDPEAWWDSARAAIREAASQVDARRVAAVGVSFQRETFALLDDENRAVRPGILWLDIRAAAETAEAADRLDPGAYHRRTGKPLDVTSVLPRMRWIARHEPAALARARRWNDVGGWLLGKLTGVPGTCVAGADTTGLVDIGTRWWAPDHLAFCGLDRLGMPGLFEPGSVVGSLSPAAAGLTGLPAGVPVAAGGGDGQCLAVGLGGRGGFTLTLGTSVVIGLPASTPTTSSLYRTLIAARPDRRFLRESVIQSGTHLLRWFEETFAGPGLDEMEQEIAALAPGSEGLVTVPHWWGVRFPESLPEARGATVGWSHRHQRAHLLRSIMEGIAFELRKLADDHRAASPELPAAVVAVGGGGTRSRAWLRILADVIGIPLVLTVDPEPAALGAAMLAATAVGAYPDVDAAATAMTREKETIAPEPATASVYESIYRGSYLPLRDAVLRLAPGVRR